MGKILNTKPVNNQYNREILAKDVKLGVRE